MSFRFEILANNIRISLQCLKVKNKKINNKKPHFPFKFFDLLQETNLFFFFIIIILALYLLCCIKDLLVGLASDPCVLPSSILVNTGAEADDRCIWDGIRVRELVIVVIEKDDKRPGAVAREDGLEREGLQEM